jgi:hypothetical protein
LQSILRSCAGYLSVLQNLHQNFTTLTTDTSHEEDKL